MKKIKTIAKVFALTACALAPFPLSSAMPPCATSCVCMCTHCPTNHMCLLQARNVTHLSGNVYLIECRFRGGWRLEDGRQVFCCKHTINTHSHFGYGTL